MKLGFAVFVTVILSGTIGFARNETTGHELMKDIETLAMKCIVRTYSLNKDGAKVYSDLKNVCAQIQVLDSKTAHVQVDNQVFKVVLRESDDADGGDLDHVLAYDLNGQLVGQKLNVVAYDNILLGLAGGKTNFVEVEESSN